LFVCLFVCFQRGQKTPKSKVIPHVPLLSLLGGITLMAVDHLMLMWLKELKESCKKGKFVFRFLSK